MPTIAADETAVHGVQLTAGAEVVVEIVGYPRTVTIVVTTPGSAPIYWNATDDAAAVASPQCRIIPAQMVATDSAPARRQVNPDGSVLTRVHLLSAAAARVSVQRGV